MGFDVKIIIEIIIANLILKSVFFVFVFLVQLQKHWIKVRMQNSEAHFILLKLWRPFTEHIRRDCCGIKPYWTLFYCVWLFLFPDQLFVLDLILTSLGFGHMAWPSIHSWTIESLYGLTCTCACLVTTCLCLLGCLFVLVGRSVWWMCVMLKGISSKKKKKKSTTLSSDAAICTVTSVSKVIKST